MVLSQYFLLFASPSLALISLHVSAGSSGVKPRGPQGKCSVNYVMVILRGVARGEFLGAPHHPPL